MGLNERVTKKYTDFTEDQINDYLVEFKNLIREGNYSIAINNNRKENRDFLEDYDINAEKAKEMLLCIDVLDFCYAVDNFNPNYAHEKLYIFCRKWEIYNRGDLETVDIYIKSNLTKTRKGKILFIVSFHKRKNPINYCFKHV